MPWEAPSATETVNFGEVVVTFRREGPVGNRVLVTTCALLG